MDWVSILLTIVLIVIVIYYYCFRNLNYLKSHGIEHPVAWPIVGNSGPTLLRRMSLAELGQQIYNVHSTAKYVGFYDFMVPMIMIRDPELIKSITVKNFEHFTDRRVFIDETVDPLFGKNLLTLRGERWKSARTLLSPAFTSSKMKTMFEFMQKCGQDFGDYLSNELAKDGIEIETKSIFSRYTNDVIATCAFGITVDSMKNPDNEFYFYGKEMTNFGELSRILKFLLIRFVPVLKNLMNLRIVSDRCGYFFKNIVKTSIDLRDEKGLKRADMLQLMMDSRGKKEQDLTLDEMTAQALIFFLGGFESTANSMAFLTHELAVNQDIQEKLQEEIDDVMRRTKGQPGYEDINSMKYLEGVISESLRMYPVLPQIDRACVKNFELPPPVPGGKPYIVRKGEVVTFPPYALHRDPEHFKNPERFDPSRFLEENNSANNMSAYLPFGIGPRICIAHRFALLEIKVLIFNLCARLHLEPCSKTNIPMKFARTGFMITSKNGFWIKMQPRNNLRKS